MRPLKQIFVATLLVAGAAGAQSRAGEPLGSPKFQPTPEQPVGWRGDGTGQYPGATPPTQWSRTVTNGKPESSGILWMTPIPTGASSPVVVGDRIFLGFDPHGLMCVSKTDGKILWYRTHHYYDVMPEEDRKKAEEKAKAPAAKIKELYDTEIKRMSAAVSPAGVSVADDKRFMAWAWNQKLFDQLKLLDTAVKEVNKEHYSADKDYWEFASATPASDGKNVFMWFCNRVGVCYDLDGNRKWAAIEPFKERKFGEHGKHSSPVLIGDKLITLYGIDLIALDAKTGKLAWTKTMPKTTGWGTPAFTSFVPAAIAGQPYVVSCRGEGYRASDGEIGWGPFLDSQGGYTSAVVDQNRIFMQGDAGLIQLQIPTTLGPTAQPTVGKSLKIKSYTIAAPLFAHGLVYYVGDKGMLRAFDPETGAAAYEKMLPLNGHIEYVFFPGYAASPTMAGKYVYIMDNQGGTVILEPGREYKEVAINRIETVEKKTKGRDGKDSAVVYEQTVSNPVFEGKLMFVRGQQYLYCIGSK